MNSEIESQSRCADLSCNASLSAVRFNEWRGGPSCRPKCLPAELLARPAFSTAIFMAVWRVWPRGTTCHTSFFLPVPLPSSLLPPASSIIPLFPYSFSISASLSNLPSPIFHLPLFSSSGFPSSADTSPHSPSASPSSSVYSESASSSLPSFINPYLFIFV